MFTTISSAIGVIGSSLEILPFSILLQPLILAVLQEYKKDKFRKGTILTPVILIWLILLSTLRRDLSYVHVLDWMLSGFRWIQQLLPAQSKIVSSGAISHARVKMGFEVFRSLYYKLVASFKNIEPDFHRWKSMIFDGTTGSMPDTRENIEKFGKPTCGTGEAAYPCLRMVTLIAASVRLILDVAYAPYCGKGTGERSLMMKIIDRLKGADFLFLLDRGLYAFNLLKKITEKGFDFIVKVPATVKNIKIIKKLPDGSFLAEITKKVRDVDAPKNKRGKHPWKTITMTVRIIRFEIPGFRPTWIMTSILDPKVTAKEIILHYHKRWDIEIAYDEIKTHQCATLTGHPHTTFRSKKPELVQQELYAILIMYNLVRNIIAKAAYEHNKDPRFISFLDSLHHMINATPMMTAAPDNPQEKFAYLLTLIADSEIDRPRRNRINPRVIKVKSSKFKRKNKKHKGKYRNIKNEIRIISDDKIIQNKVKYYQIK